MSIPGNANPLLLASAAAADVGYQIQKSVRLNDNDSARFDRTFSSSGNQRTWTVSMWFKRGNLGSPNKHLFDTTGSPEYTGLYTTTDDKMEYRGYTTGFNWVLTTTQRFRDPSAWTHIVVNFNSTASTSTDRLAMYINGSKVDDFDLETYPSQNHDSNWNNNVKHTIGGFGSSNTWDGYIAEIYSIDGQALAASSFGEFDDSGVWRPKEYSGTFGTNGFHILDFANEATAGHDSSGNSHDFAQRNISTTAGAGNDVLFDVPTNGAQSDTGAGGEVSGNYATLNAAFGTVTGSTNSPENGNLTVDGGSSANFSPTTIPVTSGKWYVEVTVAGSGNSSTVGIWKMPMTYGTNYYQNENYRYYQQDGKIYDESGATSTTYNTYAAGDVIGIALDMDNGKVFFSKNGTFQGSSVPASGTNPAASGLSGTWAIALQAGASTSHTLHLNAGQRSFSYSAPTGFKALCTTNLSDPTIADGSDYFDVSLWTGNGSTQSITGLSFSPDFVWIKNRGNTADHRVYDTVRGALKEILPNQTNAETTRANSLTAFNSDGYSLGSYGGVNNNGTAAVGWAWDAGSSTVSNTDGNITSSVRANATAGFSIVTYSGNGSTSGSVGHGLNAAPGLVIIKQRNGTKNWKVAHSSLTSQYMLNLNGTHAEAIAGWNGMDSSVFYPARSGDTYNNTSGDNYVAYCFAPVAGYSAFGSYTGNAGSSNFVHLGFRPRLLIIKRSSDGSNGWHMADTARSPENVANEYLYADTSGTEETNGSIDILSNGFCLKANAQTTNNSGVTYIYMAWAENPFQANGGLAR